MSIEDVRAQINSGIADLNEAPVGDAATKWEVVNGSVGAIGEHITRAMEIIVELGSAALPPAIEASSQVAGKAETAHGKFARAAEGARLVSPDEMLASASILKVSGDQQVSSGQVMQTELGAMAAALLSMERSLETLEQHSEITQQAAENGPADRDQAVSSAETFRDQL
jgi:hypothetical protein